jgi:hypothetical protein
MSNPLKGGGELPDYVKFQCMRQLNTELLERLKAAQAEIDRYKGLYDMLLKLLPESNGKEEVLSESVGNPEERQGEEQAVQETEEAGEEGEEIKED